MRYWAEDPNPHFYIFCSVAKRTPVWVALHKKSGQKSDVAVNKNFLDSF